MANTVIHLNSDEPEKVPHQDQMPQGRLAINTADEVLYTANSDGEVVPLASSLATAKAKTSVQAVNSNTPDTQGNVTLPSIVEYAISLPNPTEPDVPILWQYVPNNMEFLSGYVMVNDDPLNIPISILVNGIVESTTLLNHRVELVTPILSIVMKGSLLQIDSPPSWQTVTKVSVVLQFRIIQVGI